MTEPRDLPSLRAALEAADGEILAVLARRLRLVEEVAAAKLRSASPLRDGQREEQVLERVRRLAAGHGLDPLEIDRLYRVVLEISVAHQRAHVRALATAPLKIAYQGVEGSYSHLAAQARYAGSPNGVLLEGHPTFGAAVAALRSGAADHALLPIENSTAGSLDETYDLLAEGGLLITGEVVSRIEHCLLGLPGARLEELHTVLSHPQALLQCRQFLERAPWIQTRTEFDTAGAAAKVRELGDRGIAAVASAAAGAALGLEVLHRGIQTQEGNATRFVELSREPARPRAGVPVKTSLLVVLDHRPAALAGLLGVFGRRGVNLTKLESRPIPETPWRYRFYLDLEGDAAADPLRAALAEARPLVAELRELGSYPSDRAFTDTREP